MDRNNQFLQPKEELQAALVSAGNTQDAAKRTVLEIEFALSQLLSNKYVELTLPKSGLLHVQQFVTLFNCHLRCNHCYEERWDGRILPNW